MMVWVLCTHKTVLCGGGCSVTVAGSHVHVENDNWRVLLYPDPLIMVHSEARDDRGCGGVRCL